MNTLALVNQLPDWMNHQVVAGNSWGQILLFFVCVFVVWVIARIIKAWTHKLAGSSREGSTRKVFLNSLGKSLPLLGVWAGIKIGVYFIYLGETGGLAETVVSPVWKYCWWSRWRCLLIIWLKYPVPGLPGRLRKPRVNLMICSFPSCERVYGLRWFCLRW